MSYDRPSDEREYGGGGRGRDNYYNAGNNFDGSGDRRGEGRVGGYGGGDYDRRDDRREEYGARLGYGDRDENYGSGGSYGGQEERRHERREDRRDDRRDDGYSGGYGAGGGYGQQERRYEYGGGDNYGRPNEYRMSDERRHQGPGQYGGRQDEDRYSGSAGGGSFGYGGGDNSSGGYPSTNDEFGQAAQHASNHRPGDADMFSSAMSFLSGNQQRIQNEDYDEDRIQQSHQQLYQHGGSGQQFDSQSLGAGAAMQALKTFQGGNNGKQQGGGQAQMISLAMQEASKLFDQQSGQGKVASGTDKQSVITSAAKMALQMYMKNQMGGGSTSGGGPSGLMSLASKLLG
ncbi:hypothetical protein LTS08_004824 [Lithohypha guttulata]|uniref:DUF7721 domain-containing protein n=1 Tax=Lithohypha guttulata TaxID=1690604 RepID=A0AAN7T227_9EURO|nr:hypothetical protein LTR05_002334 [Lithohypha guttulata]KAK5101217.1 hypothetical protein LTS08_004824 [Lithohypha guttulata]